MTKITRICIIAVLCCAMTACTNIDMESESSSESLTAQSGSIESVESENDITIDTVPEIVEEITISDYAKEWYNLPVDATQTITLERQSMTDNFRLGTADKTFEFTLPADEYRPITLTTDRQFTVAAITYTPVSDSRITECTVIDLDKQLFIATFAPTAMEFINDADVDGTVADAFDYYAKTGNYTISCTPTRSNWYELNLNFTLHTDVVEVNGYYYVSFENYNGTTLRTTEAIIGQDAMELMPYYNAAYDVIYWFHGQDALETSYGDGDLLSLYGVTYSKIVDERFTEFETLDDLTAHFRSILTDSEADYLISRCADESFVYAGDYNFPTIVLHDGEFYCIDAARGSDSFKRYPFYYIRESTDETATLVCCVFQLEVDEESGELVPGEAIEYEYKFVCDGDIWKCDSFPIIW